MPITAPAPNTPLTAGPDATYMNAGAGVAVQPAGYVGRTARRYADTISGGWTTTPPPVKSAAAPGNVFPVEPTITASDAPNAARLAGLGYVALPTTAWTVGQKITVNTFDFNWSGIAWAAGAHA